jgi:hypothetical protein
MYSSCLLILSLCLESLYLLKRPIYITKRREYIGSRMHARRLDFHGLDNKSCTQICTVLGHRYEYNPSPSDTLYLASLGPAAGIA